MPEIQYLHQYGSQVSAAIGSALGGGATGAAVTSGLNSLLAGGGGGAAASPSSLLAVSGLMGGLMGGGGGAAAPPAAAKPPAQAAAPGQPPSPPPPPVGTEKLSSDVGILFTGCQVRRGALNLLTCDLEPRSFIPQDKETSADARPAKGKPHGAFTNALVAVVKDHESKVRGSVP